MLILEYLFHKSESGSAENQVDMRFSPCPVPDILDIRENRLVDIIEFLHLIDEQGERTGLPG